MHSSLAIILVEIFSREDPYSELSGRFEPSDILELIRTKDIRPDITTIQPPAVASIITAAWASDPDRYLVSTARITPMSI